MFELSRPSDTVNSIGSDLPPIAPHDSAVTYIWRPGRPRCDPLPTSIALSSQALMSGAGSKITFTLRAMLGPELPRSSTTAGPALVTAGVVPVATSLLKPAHSPQ
jgi:hypothetical protein